MDNDKMIVVKFIKVKEKFLFWKKVYIFFWDGNYCKIDI